jgi:hypothetical protein
MVDYDDTTATGDRFADAIALCLVVKNKTIATRLKKLRRVLRQVADAEAKVIAAEEHAAEIVAKAESDVKAINDAAQQRLDAAATAEDELVQREQKIARLENAWRLLGEPADVMSGFRSPQFSPLQKARAAYGMPAGKDPNLFGFAQDAELTEPIDALIKRDVGDERSDSQGNTFAASTLTRSTEHKRGAA